MFGYSAEHDGSSDKLAPSRASDDKKVIAAMAAFAASSGAASITISNEDFGARVSLKGLDRVQAYFQKHCGIPPSR